MTAAFPMVVLVVPEALVVMPAPPPPPQPDNIVPSNSTADRALRAEEEGRE